MKAPRDFVTVRYNKKFRYFATNTPRNFSSFAALAVQCSDFENTSCLKHNTNKIEKRRRNWFL